MSDTISRQAAIDAIERNAYRHTYIDQIVDIIKGLPSAQPEIVRCKDCKYWNPNNRECEGIGNWFGLIDAWSENGFCYKGERVE